MRARYWRTSSLDVMRPCSIAARISGIVASTTVKERGAGAVVVAGFFDCADAVVKTAAAIAAAASRFGFMAVIINESDDVAPGCRPRRDDRGIAGHQPV